MKNLRTPVFLVIGIVAVFALSFGAIAVYKKFAGRTEDWDKVSGPKPSQLSRQEREARCVQVIGKAEAAAKSAVAIRGQYFHDFVAQRQYRIVAGGRVAVAAFAEDILSLGSKGRLIWAKMPFTDRDGYKKHVSHLFSVYFFTAEELGAEFKRAVEGSLKDVEAIENQLAVELQEVITGTPTTPGLRATAPEAFRGAIEKIVAAGQTDAAKDVGKLVASELVAQIGVQVFVRVGVSAGLLAAGAASSPWTLGAGLVIGILADLAWGWIDNPEADIQREILQSTSKVAVDGMNALNAELATVIQRRSNLWRLSANELVK
jgi:hypothetical protein